MRKMTNEKGITLIALIITIIVMLILVGVTINVALNGGLFEKAETATKQTQIEAEKEELLSAVVAAIGTDAKVDFDYLDDNLPNNWDGEDGTYTSPKGNSYTVDENGKIEEDTSGGTEPPEVVDPEPETISIAGTYGGGMLALNDDGTGEYSGDSITYTVDESLNGSLIMDGEELADFKVEIKEDGTKVFYMNSVTRNNDQLTVYAVVYTTTNSAVFEEMEDITYTAQNSSTISEIEFKDGNATYKYSDGTTANGEQNCVTDGTVIYKKTSDTVYQAYYVVYDGKIELLWS